MFHRKKLFKNSAHGSSPTSYPGPRWVEWATLPFVPLPASVYIYCTRCTPFCTYLLNVPPQSGVPGRMARNKASEAGSPVWKRGKHLQGDAKRNSKGKAATSRCPTGSAASGCSRTPSPLVGKFKLPHWRASRSGARQR